jgi:1-deoxy-D-xylulose-5-phosphate synthase
VGTGLQHFQERYPERCFDVGMAEEHGVTCAAGMAAAGLRPVVAIYSTFMQRSYDQILHDVCLQGLPVVLALDRAGLVGDDGPTHHGVFDLSYLRNIPHMTIMAPADEKELRDMLLTALALGSPAAIRYPRGQGAGADISGPMEVIPVGRGRIVREGDQVTIIAIGTMLATALAAADTLADEGIRAAVADARFVKPLDEELILQRAAAGPLVTVEENVLAGGFGAAIVELLHDRGVCTAGVRRLGIKDEFISHGSRTRLWAESGIDADGIAAAARALVEPTSGERPLS